MHRGSSGPRRTSAGSTASRPSRISASFRSTSTTPALATPDLERWIDHPSGWLALSPRNARFERPGAPGFVAYREQGKHLVTFGGVHAPEAERAPLLAAFLAHAEGRRKRVLAVQVRAAQAALFAAHGFTVNRFGASYGLSIASHGLGGGAHRARRALRS